MKVTANAKPTKYKIKSQLTKLIMIVILYTSIKIRGGPSSPRCRAEMMLKKQPITI